VFASGSFAGDGLLFNQILLRWQKLKLFQKSQSRSELTNGSPRWLGLDSFSASGVANFGQRNGSKARSKLL